MKIIRLMMMILCNVFLKLFHCVNFLQLFSQRSRLNSARTLSEGSEGSGLDNELAEGVSLSGSLRRQQLRAGRDSSGSSTHHTSTTMVHRSQSAVSKSPSYRPEKEEEEEEDHYGYVLPGVLGTPERGERER